jgi:hypothetical protein
VPVWDASGTQVAHDNIVTLTLVSRSINNRGEERRFKSLNRYSNDSDIPNNVLDGVTLNNLQQDSTSVKKAAQENISTKHSDKLIEPYSTGESGLSQRCGSTLNQTHGCDEFSDLIVSVKASSKGEKNSYMMSKTWPKALKLSNCQHQKTEKVPKPTRI